MRIFLNQGMATPRNDRKENIMNAETLKTETTTSEETTSSTTATPPTPEQMMEALKSVIDPEIGLSLVELGLIYQAKMLETTPGTAYVLMTLTSPMCPMGPQIMNDVHQTAKSIPGVSDVKVELTFNPAWDPRTMASEETKMLLGIY